MERVETAEPNELPSGDQEQSSLADPSSEIPSSNDEIVIAENFYQSTHLGSQLDEQQPPTNPSEVEQKMESTQEKSHVEAESDVPIGAQPEEIEEELPASEPTDEGSGFALLLDSNNVAMEIENDHSINANERDNMELHEVVDEASTNDSLIDFHGSEEGLPLVEFPNADEKNLLSDNSGVNDLEDNDRASSASKEISGSIMLLETADDSAADSVLSDLSTQQNPPNLSGFDDEGNHTIANGDEYNDQSVSEEISNDQSSSYAVEEQKESGNEDITGVSFQAAKENEFDPNSRNTVLPNDQQSIEGTANSADQMAENLANLSVSVPECAIEVTDDVYQGTVDDNQILSDDRSTTDDLPVSKQPPDLDDKETIFQQSIPENNTPLISNIPDVTDEDPQGDQRTDEALLTSEEITEEEQVSLDIIPDAPDVDEIVDDAGIEEDSVDAAHFDISLPPDEVPREISPAISLADIPEDAETVQSSLSLGQEQKLKTIGESSDSADFVASELPQIPTQEELVFANHIVEQAVEKAAMEIAEEPKTEETSLAESVGTIEAPPFASESPPAEKEIATPNVSESLNLDDWGSPSVTSSQTYGTGLSQYLDDAPPIDVPQIELQVEEDEEKVDENVAPPIEDNENDLSLPRPSLPEMASSEFSSSLIGSSLPSDELRTNKTPEQIEEKLPPLPALSPPTSPIPPLEELNARFSAVSDDGYDSVNEDDKDRWLKTTIRGAPFMVDLKAIANFKKFLSFDGFTDKREAIITLTAAYLPAPNEPNYNYIINHLFCYVTSAIDLLAPDDYVLVYFHCNRSSGDMPPMAFCSSCYGQLDIRLRKNAKAVYVVHPNGWVKTASAYLSAFKQFARSKLIYVPNLAELKARIPTEFMHFPPEVLEVDKTIKNGGQFTP